jgi:hypothetical protein
VLRGCHEPATKVRRDDNANRTSRRCQHAARRRSHAARVRADDDGVGQNGNIHDLGFMIRKFFQRTQASLEVIL